MIDSGAGFVIPEAGTEDVFIRARDLGTAVHGDRVSVRVERRTRRGPRGRVVEVLQRARSSVVGVFRRSRGHGWLDVTEPRLALRVFIPERDRGDAAEGDLALAEVTDWGDEGTGPAGRVERVLGRPGEPGVEVLAIQVAHGLADAFPADVARAAGSLRARGLEPRDLEGREDCRDMRTFTIDPVDARDHDDALSFERLRGGRVRVGVHIADVSHYVREGDVIDAEAWERGTSVYLVDRVLPMLPHALSNDLCSLVPGKDRLTLTAFLELDAGGALTGTRFGKTAIRSAHRLSYEEAQAILDGRETGPGRTDPGLRRDLQGLLRVARRFRERRRARGSLEFDLPEAYIQLDEDGVPVHVRRRERLASHRLVEDLMIAANEAVARWAIEEGVPVLYRIHEEPDGERIEPLQLLAAEFGFSFPSRNPRPRDFQRLLDAVKGRVEEPVVSVQVLKSLARARYAASNEGHFGLASPAYLHFTSPIRRYPDLVVHRQLARWFADPASARAVAREWLEETARHASVREEIATRAERDSVDLKKVEFMEGRLGDQFAGTISGVARFGLFVRLEAYDIEGVVHVSALGGDYFVPDATRRTLKGRRTRKAYRLGDAVEVRVVRVDREGRRIDFDLV